MTLNRQVFKRIVERENYYSEALMQARDQNVKQAEKQRIIAIN